MRGRLPSLPCAGEHARDAERAMPREDRKADRGPSRGRIGVSAPISPSDQSDSEGGRFRRRAAWSGAGRARWNAARRIADSLCRREGPRRPRSSRGACPRAPVAILRDGHWLPGQHSGHEVARVPLMECAGRVSVLPGNLLLVTHIFVAAAVRHAGAAFDARHRALPSDLAHARERAGVHRLT